MNKRVFLSDKEVADHLFPFTQTRSVADIRVGMLTIREKWEKLLQQPIKVLKKDEEPPNDAIVFAANIIPTAAFIKSIFNPAGEATNQPDYSSVKILQYPWHIFQWNDWALREDYLLITQNRTSEPIPETVQTANAAHIFIEPGAVLNHCILNASTGPVYIGKNAEIMEGALIRGPFSLGEGAVVKMGAKIYGATTIGPYCMAGGEIKNSILFGYSNKAHDGYLGDSVIGEWCNLGAGTSNSNIKNTASEVNVWHYQTREYIRAGIKCGLLMGDYSRSAINTSFNTGTVVGVCANIFGEGMPPKFVPSFTWGNKGLSLYEFEKALADISNWKKLKNQVLGEEEINQLKHIFGQS
ncbi:glucose-1-phosphate thymidylyltransferase [Niastella caeni]|uniref:Glucose-1-phosphate thymidylyltransferase n=1 Tax=Niastella caeni TaxID=2569763 RepID=A0A4S8HAR0_9BACT|nr:putative sugar nucleotidyl transferase [Niastella caeni]THU30434.1 glucose-1-phosphate thymidylyltransferase [Niastella caeni]